MAVRSILQLPGRATCAIAIWLLVLSRLWHITMPDPDEGEIGAAVWATDEHSTMGVSGEVIFIVPSGVVEHGRHSADADLLFEKAQAAEEIEDWDAAERLYGLVLKIDPADTASAFNLANVLRAQNKLVEAEAAYRMAVEREPDFAEAWYNLAGLLEEQRRFHEAVSRLDRAIKAEPDYADAVFNLALLLQRLDRTGDAAKQWRRYLEIGQASAWAGRAKKALKLYEMQRAFS